MCGSVYDKRCEVNEIAAKNCTTSRNFDDLEINDVLENIKVLLNYIKKQKKKKGSFAGFRPASEGAGARTDPLWQKVNDFSLWTTVYGAMFEHHIDHVHHMPAETH